MIDLKRLRHLVLIADEGSFISAAGKLGLSQPALSRSIQTLESECGFLLFDRSRRGATPTAAAHPIIRQARRLLNESTMLDHMLNSVRSASSGSVSFGMGPMLASALLPDMFSEIAQEKPRARLKVTIDTGANLLQQILNDELVFCCCAAPLIPPGADVNLTPFAQMRVMRLARREHPIFTKGRSPDEFPLMSSAAVLRTGAEINPSFVCENYDILEKATLQSDAVWLTTHLSAQIDGEHGPLRIVPLSTDIKDIDVASVLITRINRNLSPLAREVIGRLKSNVRNREHKMG